MKTSLLLIAFGVFLEGCESRDVAPNTNVDALTQSEIAPRKANTEPTTDSLSQLRVTVSINTNIAANSAL